MSDDKTAAPAAATDTPAPVATPPAAPPAPAKIVDDGSPVWLSERLRREGAAALKAAGIKVGKDDDPKKVAAEAKAKNDSRKEKLRAEKSRADAAEQKAAELEQQRIVQESALKVYAETELAQLPEAHRTFIKRAAGDDVAEQLKAISLFKATGGFTAAAPAAPAPAASTSPAAPVLDAPASTSPAASAPTPANPQTTDIKATYRNLRATNPYLAAQFILNHPELVPEPGKT